MFPNNCIKLSLLLVFSPLLLTACPQTKQAELSSAIPAEVKNNIPGLQKQSGVISQSETSNQPAENPTTSSKISPSPSLPNGWKTYQSAQGRFSIAMPGTPHQEEQPIQLPSGESVPLKIASLDQQDIAYFTGYVDYPEDLVNNSQVNVQDILSGSIQGATKADFGSSVVKQTETSVNGVPCRSFQTSGSLKGTKARMDGVFCLEGDRLFEVLVIGEEKPSFTQMSNTFISSFDIQRR